MRGFRRLSQWLGRRNEDTESMSVKEKSFNLSDSSSINRYSDSKLVLVCVEPLELMEKRWLQALWVCELEWEHLEEEQQKEKEELWRLWIGALAWRCGPRCSMSSDAPGPRAGVDSHTAM